MSSSLADTLERTFRGVVVGPPAFDSSANLPNMVVYPLFPEELAADPPELISLSQGLRRGVRVTDTGTVSQVHVDNPLPATVLVGESEILVGPTQLRAVQFSCLVPPGRRASLPVNCVEAGQPTVYQAQFTGTDSCPWYLRSFKIEQLARHGESHQHSIWERIREYLHHTGTVSSTQDLSAVYDEFGGDVDRLSQVFPLRSGQVGCICAVGQDLFLELFGDPEVMEDRYEGVLRSALVEAVAHPTREVIPVQAVESLLGQIVEASHASKVVHSRSLGDSGRTQVFCAGGIAGTGLMAGGRLIHLSAHKRCWGFGRPFSEQLGDLERDRQLREKEQLQLRDRLEREYPSRRRRYESFLRNLRPAAAPRAATPFAADGGGGADADPPPRPLPLHPGLHELFLQLFRRE